MKLHTVKPNPFATKTKKRVGRGPGSGTGKTAGRGENGQKSRKNFYHSRSFNFKNSSTILNLIFTFLYRNKLLLFSCESVKNFHCFSSSSFICFSSFSIFDLSTHNS